MGIDAGTFGPVPFDAVAVGDTETTGLFPFGADDSGSPSGDPHGPDRLCSVAFRILCRDGDGWQESGAASWLLDPCRPVPEGAAKVNGFAWQPGGPRAAGGRTNLAGLPSFADLAGEIRAFVGDLPLVFHNAAFDAAVLDAELLRAGLAPLVQPVLCTKKAFSDVRGLGRPHHYLPGTNLNALCDLLGVDRSARIGADGAELHGAAVDAQMAARCFVALDGLGWMLAEDPDDLPHRAAIRRRALAE